MTTEKQLKAQIAALQSELSELRKQKQDYLLGEVLYHAESPFIAGRSNGELAVVNTGFCKLTGYSEAELLQKNWVADLTPAKWHKREARVVQKIIETGQPRSYEKEFLHKDGTAIAVLVQAHPMLNEAGQLQRLNMFISDISQQKQTEEARHHYERIISATPDLISVVDGSYVYRLVNEAYLTAHAKKRDEIVGHAVPDLMGEEKFKELVKPNLDRCLAGETISYQAWFDFAGAGRKFANVTYFPYTHADGTIDGVVVSVQNITAQKKAQEALQESQMKNQALLEALPDLMFRLNTAGKFLDFKASSDQLYLNPEEIIGSNIKDLPLNDFADMTMQYIQQAVETQELQSYEYQLSVAGGMQDFEARMVPSGPNEVTAIVRNITEEKLSEKELRASKRILRTVLDTIPSFVFWKDTELVYEGCNIHFAHAAGLDEPDDIIGKTDFDLPWRKAEAEQYRADDQEVIQTETAKLNIMETQLQADGQQKWVNTSKTPLYNNDEEIIGVLGIFTDITEQRQAEIERQHLQEELIEAQRLALQELSMPIIPLLKGIIVLPIVGNVDSMRARDLMHAILQGINDHRATTVIMDITGVQLIDTGIANHLDKTIQAARLKGARTIVTGMSDAVAETLVDLGVDWTKVETVRDLQTGLTVALKQLGMKLVKF